MRLALIGFGNIATTLLGLLQSTQKFPLENLTIVSSPGREKAIEAEALARFFDIADTLKVVSTTQDLLATRPDLVLECASHTAVKTHGVAVLAQGVDFVLASIGALSDARLELDLIQAAENAKSRLVLPAGAIGGIDLLAALRPAGNLQVTYRGIKPPNAWKGTKAEAQLDLESVQEKTVFFTGTAREAASAFPKNANVAATLALAGAGFDQTRAELVADPNAAGNIHEYSVTSPLAHYTLRVENQPSHGNAKTSVSTVYSLLREITNRIGPLAI
ncbi:aspartate dehydrogenase [Shimia sediminis]|uniref:aspartate dehydrogenase n=1 Tax=Shimia sediminis TaxID=2497945 RepID=UPI000F8DE025|nr:aspartate dehydrogenase [Shimia sediminis]